MGYSSSKLDRDVALHLAEVKAYQSGTVALRYEVHPNRGKRENAIARAEPAEK